MKQKIISVHRHCSRCAVTDGLDMSIAIAFQPIVDCLERRVIGYEALVRGSEDQDAEFVMSSVTKQNRYAFDQMCRAKAIEYASQLGMQDKFLSINFLPNAIHNPEQCISSTLEVARKFNFPFENIIFEFTEAEKFTNLDSIKQIINTYKVLGFKTAIDDFGSGYAGLSLLADLQTNIVKFDMALIRNIHSDIVRQTIFSHTLSMLNQLNIDVIAEGIESKQEMRWLRSVGVRFMQGFYFAKPEINALPLIDTRLFELH
jgi:EAL domain-containing protein (putative c-di-GMP-specific phosphodiesterase class I)